MNKFERKVAELVEKYGVDGEIMTMQVKDWYQIESEHEELRQKLQTLKETIKTYFLLESDYWANMDKENISKFEEIQRKLDDQLK